MEVKKTTSKIYYLFLYALALVGAIFVFVFVAMQFGWLNVRGSASERNSYFNLKANIIDVVQASAPNSLDVLCKINVLHTYAPITSVNIYKTLIDAGDVATVNTMIQAASLRFQDNLAFQHDMTNCSYDTNQMEGVLPNTAYPWADSAEWALMKEVFTRDQDIIKLAAHNSGVEPRILLGGVIGEQFRFFGNRRESFKQYFEPLKILASLSNTSYGIAGLKPKTLGQIEDHLKDVRSPFYLGPEMEHIITYESGADIESVRFARITDVKIPYYSYLYVGLFMHQIQTQWQNAGFDISHKPEVFGTLYNLGFYYSVPKENPESGGSTITVNDVPYTFGDLAYEFYYSGELGDIFPFGVK